MEDTESMDDFFEEEEVFLENAVHCPLCDELTGHEILKEKAKGTGKDYLLKCIDCSKVHTVHLRPPPVVVIPFILTEGPTSSTTRLEIDADEMIELEDVFKDGEKLWKINQIELKTGKFAKRAEASLIARASALRSDMVRGQHPPALQRPTAPSVVSPRLPRPAAPPWPRHHHSQPSPLLPQATPAHRRCVCPPGLVPLPRHALRRPSHRHRRR